MNYQTRWQTICFAAALSCAATSAAAQVATGGNYSLDQAVIASGGGQNSTGDNFALDGTTGQTAAGTRSASTPFSVVGGFWTTQPFSPTSASVTVSGMILVPGGKGLTNARVILADSQGNTRMAISSSFGYYRFEDVAVGETYVLSVSSKRYQFNPQAVIILEEMTELNFSAIQ
jgi:hypothetical protein